MIALIETRRVELADLCREHHVQRLELFGSGVSDADFDPTRSDLDFLVEFLPMEPGRHKDAYFGLLEGLRSLFDRPVDLVEAKAVRNPYFLESVNRTRTVLYAA